MVPLDLKHFLDTLYQLVGVLLVFVLVILLVSFIIAGWRVYISVTNFIGERRVRSQMRRAGRYLRSFESRQRISESRGTLIIENPSLDWDISRAWWTPDDLLAESPYSIPSDEEYDHAIENMKCLDWDEWCWRNYTSTKSGTAMLLRSWNGQSLESKLKSCFPNLNVVRTRTALAQFPVPIGGTR